MNIKNIPFKPKKIPYYLSLILLTVGASLILGFLSFGGMYALLPILPLAFAAFGLSVAYEGEIYLQNIKGALKKLFKKDYLENHIAKDYLLAHFPEDTHAEGYPQFFKDYEIQLQLLNAFGHKELNSDSKKRKRQVEKTLSDMEKWFTLQLFPKKDKPTGEESDYTKQLREWLTKNHQEEWQERIKNRHIHFNLVAAFSVTAGIFMGLGSTYLIVEAFTVIPLFATIPFVFWPIIILPMAIIAGAAYAFLTYNAITDLINNNTIVKWYTKLRNDLSEGLTFRNVGLTIAAILLVGLAIALTVCTAGTWWTVATHARPLFEWMSKLPSFIMGIINPIITGISAIFFNIQNTAESLEMLDTASRSKTNIFQSMYQSIVDGWNHLRATENWLQIFNPFRILIKLTVTPLRILLFFGHLLSIAVTSDRMPGIPQIVSALIAIISEGFEDAHYFVGHNHEHGEGEHHEHVHDHGEHQLSTKKLLNERLDVSQGHSHDADIPTLIIKGLASPLYALAAAWDSVASRLNAPSANEPFSEKQPRVITFAQAWDKQRGNPIEEEVQLPSSAKRPSSEWQVEHTLAQLEKYEEKHFGGPMLGRELADAKVRELHSLKNKIRFPQEGATLADTLTQAKNQPIYNQHRLFAKQDEKTSTQTFIESLPERVNVVNGMS